MLAGRGILDGSTDRDGKLIPTSIPVPAEADTKTQRTAATTVTKDTLAYDAGRM
jgi:hypothetical protein